jgi:hypothetical protein
VIGFETKFNQEEFTMLESIVVIASSTCSNSDAFTTTTTDGSEENQCLESLQVDATSQPTPELQAQ